MLPYSAPIFLKGKSLKFTIYRVLLNNIVSWGFGVLGFWGFGLCVCVCVEGKLHKATPAAGAEASQDASRIARGKHPRRHRLQPCWKLLAVSMRPHRPFAAGASSLPALKRRSQEIHDTSGRTRDTSGCVQELPDVCICSGRTRRCPELMSRCMLK